MEALFEKVFEFCEEPEGEREVLVDEFYDKDGLIYCKKCGGARQFEYEGRIIKCICKCQKEQYDKEEAEKNEQQKSIKVEEKRAESIPAKYRQYTFSNADSTDKQTLDVCKKYVKIFADMIVLGQGLLFYGDTGTGKTYSAMCIANALISKGYNVCVATMDTAIANATSFDNQDVFYGALERASLIVLDDFGATNDTLHNISKTLNVIDFCCSHNKCLIVTTNLMKSELESGNADSTDLKRILERLNAKCLLVKVNNVKHRQRQIEMSKDSIAKLLGVKNG